MELQEGRYHQIRRMFSAIGNHVETLHRLRIGGLKLGGLEPGAHKVLTPHDLNILFSS